MKRDAIETVIRTGFAGVRLGSGTSLRQAAAPDDFGDRLTKAIFDALPASEVTDDWARVPDEELRRDRIAYLDAEGLRYYLPALMLWLLDHYSCEAEQLGDDYAFLTVIGTLDVLTPEGDLREAGYAKFDTFSGPQRAAIAAYLDALPDLVDLDPFDAGRIRRALRDYWRPFLQAENMGPTAEEAGSGR